ncbi:hypothetical protein [Natronobiforma cellulositropha]|nr:hypothetical protein [Natronobiforma cellulositropha]
MDENAEAATRQGATRQQTSGHGIREDGDHGRATATASAECEGR